MISKVRQKLRLWYHKNEIKKFLDAYKALTGRSGAKKQAYSDSGTFHSQLERLFSLGNATETGDLERIATSSVYSCLSSRYYKPADFLADICHALESHTYLSLEPGGEPPLTECDEVCRPMKLRLIMEYYLVPAKVASVETIMRRFAATAKGDLPYRSLAAFERQMAGLYGLLGQSETTFVEKEICEFIQRWKEDSALRDCFPEPADAIRGVMSILLGQEQVENASTMRKRKPGLPFRLGTLVPEDRQYLLRAALSRLT